MASKKLRQIYNTNNDVHTEHKRHNYILNRIKQKITENNAIWAQADKGRTSVVVYKQDYNQKIENFITENEIHQTPKNPVNKDCKIIRDTLQKKQPYIHQGTNKTPDTEKTNTTQTKRTYKNTQTG
jgi:uncharacterized protein YpuA (DUF1002 family)